MHFHTLDRIKHVLVSPAHFFQTVRKEKGMREAWKFYAIIALVGGILNLISNALLQQYYQAFLQQMFNITLPAPEIGGILGAAFTTFAFIFGYLLSLGLVFLGAAFLHAWCIIFGGKGEYEHSFKLAVYAATPKLALSWIPIINVFTWVWDIALLIIGTQALHAIPRRRAILMYVIPAALLVLFFILMAVFFITLLQKNPGIFQMALAQRALTYGVA